MEPIRNSRNLIINPTTNRFLELDILVPSLNIAIEYGALYFHKNPERDALKISLCAGKGITLYQIWDHDWKRLSIEEKINKISSMINMDISLEK